MWFSIIHAQVQEPWKRIGATTQTAKLTGDKETADPILFQLNEEVLKSRLKVVKDNVVLEITIPNVNGVLEKFLIRENSNFEKELQAKYPEIRSYSGTGITDPAAVLNFSMSPSGIQTMITRGGNQNGIYRKRSR